VILKLAKSTGILSFYSEFLWVFGEKWPLQKSTNEHIPTTPAFSFFFSEGISILIEA